MSEKAVLEVIKKQTKEHTDLLHRFNTLLKVHTEAVDKCALIESKRYDLRKDNAELRKMLKECQKDCKILCNDCHHLFDRTRGLYVHA